MKIRTQNGFWWAVIIVPQALFLASVITAFLAPPTPAWLLWATLISFVAVGAFGFVSVAAGGILIVLNLWRLLRSKAAGAVAD